MDSTSEELEPVPKHKGTGEAAPSVEIYQFRLSLKGISPVIWRRVLIRSDQTLADLHYVIQILMDWSNFYLHQFIIYGKRYAVYRPHGPDAQTAEQVRLQDLRLRLNGQCLYEYSFFEWWQHEIRLEKKLMFDTKKTYPMCIGGARAAPPEDCGGAEGFVERQDYFSEGHIVGRLLEMHDQFQSDELPDNDEVERYLGELEHFRYWLNAAHFDRAAANRRLKWYAVGDERWTEGLDSL